MIPQQRVLMGMETRSRVVEFVAASPSPVRVKDVAAHLGQTDGSAHRHLAALVQSGIIARQGTRYSRKDSRA